MVSTYAAAVPMFTSGKTSFELFAERCTPIDNVCHGREGHGHDFFYIYPCKFTNSNIHLPFDEFTMGVLRTLNMAPMQLHPNSWVSLKRFGFLPRCSISTLLPICFFHITVPALPILSSGSHWLANLITFFSSLFPRLINILKILFSKLS